MKIKLAPLFIPLLLLSSCGGEAPSSESSSPSSSSRGEKTPIEVKEREVQKIDDFYRNYYQIFPISFADSNNDGKGDLQGIIDKFDYITSLNMTGIWLNPVHPSPSYHKYDVTDYKAIDPIFGTLDDYDDLVDVAHKAGVTIILDLVFNHSSNQHSWFIECLEAHISGDTSNKYYNYYNVVDSTKETPPGKYYRYKNSDYYYEGQFVSDMPDFNLQGIIDGTNTNLINDFKDIMSFWLIDHDIDGFRLDACTSFFTGDSDKNYQFLNWLKKTAEEIKPNTYIIGEVLENSTRYSQFYKNTNTDSYFSFDDSVAQGNDVYTAILKSNITYIEKFIKKDIENSHGHVPAPTLANHDIGRSVKGDVNKNKLQQALFACSNGATFEYYGEEIAMRSASDKDPDKRLPLKWGDTYTCDAVKEASSYTENKIYPLGGVSEQDNDADSTLNYVRKAFKYRLENPELARGNCSIHYISEDKKCGILKREYNNSVVYMAINLSTSEEIELNIKDLNVEIVGDLSVGETPYFAGDVLVMPAQSFLLLH